MPFRKWLNHPSHVTMTNYINIEYKLSQHVVLFNNHMGIITKGKDSYVVKGSLGVKVHLGWGKFSSKNT